MSLFQRLFQKREYVTQQAKKSKEIVRLYALETFLSSA